MFQKRHYMKLALLLQECAQENETDYQGGLDLVKRKLADMLQADNPEFLRGRFLTACEPGANVRARRAA